MYVYVLFIFPDIKYLFRASKISEFFYFNSVLSTINLAEFLEILVL